MSRLPACRLVGIAERHASLAASCLPLCCAVLRCVLLQGPGFSEQVASLQAEVRLLKKANVELTENHKVRRTSNDQLQQVEG